MHQLYSRNPILLTETSGELLPSAQMRASAPTYILGLFKERVRREGVREWVLDADYFTRVVKIYLGALVATDVEGRTRHWARREGSGFAERNLMPREEVAPTMEPVVLADHDPAVTDVIPHAKAPCKTQKLMEETSASRMRVRCSGRGALSFLPKYTVSNSLTERRGSKWDASRNDNPFYKSRRAR